MFAAAAYPQVISDVMLALAGKQAAEDRPASRQRCLERLRNSIIMVIRPTVCVKIGRRRPPCQWHLTQWSFAWQRYNLGPIEKAAVMRNWNMKLIWEMPIAARQTDKSIYYWTSSCHLLTKFSQPPNFHIPIISPLFNLLAALALHLLAPLLGHQPHLHYE